ncbi:MAG: DUF3426 domain-containing protein [Desulfobacteraceae bacterium]|jgi:predicted Zn finger-like uncharacterized protein|nr:DUF3426 domain-containing protein [Desulfobacteraceae bacterium]
MIITCENCHASYKLDDSLLDPAGSRVRCTNCGHVFVAQPPTEAPPSDDDARVAAPVGGALGGIDELSERQRREFEKEFESDLNASASAGEERGFDLDLDRDDTGKTDEAGDSEGLSLDLDLDLDDDVKGFAADTEDFENLDLDLELEPVTTQLPEKAVTRTPSDEDLDLEEIQKMLTIDDEALEAVSGDGQQPVGGDTEALADLELDLGETEEAVDAGDSEELALDLNLDMEETGVPQEAADTDASDLDLDLDLDLEEAGAETPGSLDLDLDLDLEDTEGLPRSEAAGVEDLDLSLEPINTEPMQTETEVFEEQELDLGDIDMMLHADEQAVALAEGADQKENGTEASPDALGRETAEIVADLARAGEPAAELDVYGEESGAPRDPVSDDEIATLGEAYTLRASSDADGQTSLTAEPEQIMSREAVTAAGKRRSVWPLVVLLLLGLVGGGVYWAQQQGLDLAFLSQLVGQEAADEGGNLKISTLAIDSRFVDNATAGRLFVISGKARNDYDRPRSQIQIKGSILAKGKRLVGSETVFCGNVLTDLDLNRLGIGEIKQRLGLKTGANDSNVDVPPGGLVPFMVVFDNLPPDLEEFTIEVVSSR